MGDFPVRKVRSKSAEATSPSDHADCIQRFRSTNSISHKRGGSIWLRVPPGPHHPPFLEMFPRKKTPS